MDILLSTVTKAVGWTIIHSLWQGAVVYILLAGLLKLYPKMSSGSKYNLSFSAMLGIFGWALFTFSNELVKSNDTIGSGHSYGLSRSIIDSLPSILDRSIPLLVMTYLIGICFHISSLIFDFYKVNRLRTIGLIDLASDLQHEFSKLASGLGITRKVQFNISSKVTVPIVVGYLKPIILFPVSVITQLDSRQLESIVIHELSHIRRNDYLLNLMKIFMETILFFNPFVLMTGKIINIEREQACDDLVVEMTNDPLVYVESLLEIQKLKYSQDCFSLAISGKNHYLLERVKRLTNGDVKNSRIKRPLALMLILFSFVILAWIPVEFKRSVTPVSVKKNEQSGKIPVREILEKQQSVNALKPNSTFIQKNDREAFVEKKQCEPKKLSGVIGLPQNQDSNPTGFDNKTKQVNLNSAVKPELVSPKKEKPGLIITDNVNQVLGHINLESKTTIFQTKSGDTPDSQLKTLTIHYKLDDKQGSEARTLTVPYKPSDNPYSQKRSTTIFLNSGDIPDKPTRTTTIRYKLNYTPNSQPVVEMIDGPKIIP